MTAVGQVPDHVQERVAKREAAGRRSDTCTQDGCDQPWTRSGSGHPGLWCTAHYRWPSVPTPDSARTLDGLRTKAGIPLNATFTARTTFDDKAEAKGQRVSAARRAAARGDST